MRVRIFSFFLNMEKVEEGRRVSRLSVVEKTKILA
jgi:hypothetical protein